MIDYQLRQREYLLQISRAMTSRLDLPTVLRLILENAAEMLRGQAGLIALRQEDGGLRVQASYGLPPDILHLFTPLLTDVPAQAEREYLIPSTGSGHRRWTIPNLQMKLSLVVSAIGLGLRQVVALPLIMEGNLIGVIYIFRSQGGAFSANDRQVLASFADQAAIAVHNARLYQQLAREKRRLAAIIQNSADGVMILDTQRRIRVFNRALEEMTGWAAEEALGQPCSRVLALTDRQGKDIPSTGSGHRCEATRPLLQPEPEEHLYVEGDIKRPDGSIVTVGITYSPLHDREGRLVSVLANVRDITRFREAEEMKSTFVSVISHELKSPVSIIKGYADTLRREDAQWDTDTLRQGLAIIAEESDRLNRLIDNLLDASRLQASAFKLELSYVQVDKLAEKVTEEFRTQSDEHMFTLDFPSDFPAVQADIERLRQVLTNLLSNAIKYSPRGGLIRTGGWADADWVYVAVADEGIGIPQSEQERIFERFYRAESPLSRRTEGAGLGLYLCKEVIEAHGGKIWVTSEPGRGAKFVFKLPRSFFATNYTNFH
jgi:PAS domain S-box-containing protein